MGMEPTFNPVGLFGFRDWKCSDEQYNRDCMDNLFNFLREEHPDWTASQVRAFLTGAISEVDERAHI